MPASNTARALGGVSSAAAKPLSSMPRMLYGTAWKAERTADLVQQAVKNGFRGVDTAGQRKHYREDLVGLGIAQARKELGLKREEIWIQTKLVAPMLEH
jgi:diketogulonate reductase-like aldo/keto reductase